MLVALQDNGPETRNPEGELSLPIIERRLGDDDEMRARDAAMYLEVAKEGDGLERLAEAL